MLADASLAFRDIWTAPFRGLLFKSLALTLALLAALWTILAWLAARVVSLPYPWLDSGFTILAGIIFVIALGFLVAPVTALFAGLFLDDIAEVVERLHYPQDPPGRPLPFGRSLATSLRFLGVVLLVNVVALPLVLFVGFGAVIFLLANSYLLGREYFQMAALRLHDGRVVDALRERHGGRIFTAGLIVAAFLAVPILNLLTPLFATAFMVHAQKRIAAFERRPGGVLAA